MSIFQTCGAVRLCKNAKAVENIQYFREYTLKNEYEKKKYEYSCKNTGMTPDIARRLRQHVEHLAGCAKYTRSHPVTALALLLTTDTATTARQLEARIKRLTRAQKDALIADPAKIADLCPALAGADIRPVPGAALADYLPNAEKPADA